jgi:hypothetical protein
MGVELRRINAGLLLQVFPTIELLEILYRIRFRNLRQGPEKEQS